MKSLGSIYDASFAPGEDMMLMLTEAGIVVFSLSGGAGTIDNQFPAPEGAVALE